MSEFKINVPGVKEAGTQFKEISKDLTNYVKKLEEVRNNLSQHSYGDIKSALISLENEQKRNIKGVKAMEEALYNIVEYYEKAEKSISNTSMGKQKKLDLKKEFEKYVDDILKDLIKMLKGENEDCCDYGGDPINLATGNFVYHREYLKQKGLYPMEFKMFYNSVEQQKGVLGKGWVHNYQIGICREGQRAVLHWSDGREDIFMKDLDGQYTHLIGKHDTLKEVEEGLCYQTIFGQTYVFNQEGRVIKAADQNGNELMYSYDAKGKLAGVKSISGEALCYQYNADGLLETVSDCEGRTVNLSYEDDCLIQVKDEENHTFQYGYDAKGNLSQITNGRKIQSIRNEYDNEGRVTKQYYPDGGVMQIEYKDEEKILHVTEQNGNEIDYIHDERFRSVETVYTDGRIQYSYNDQNKKTQVIDKRGNRTKYDYDTAGNMTLVENPLGEKMEFEYNAMKQITEIKICGEDFQQSEYDLQGNLIKRTDALGREFAVAYLKNGKPKEIIQPDGSIISLTHDDHGNIISIREPMGGETHYEYDSFGQVTATVDGNGNRTEYAYNRRGHIIKVTSAKGETKHFSYNESGKVICVEDYDGSKIQREYNEINKPCQLINQEGSVTTLEYDRMWNLARKVDANGGETRFIYNKLNRLERIINAKGAEFHYEYDSNGNRTKIVDSNGGVVTMKYDALNRLITIEDADGAVSHMEYNQFGQRTKLVDAMGNTRRITYDKAGQKVSSVDAKGNETKYCYNSLGRVSEVIDPAGRKTTYDYLPGGLLNKVTHADGTFVIYTYDSNRNVKSKSIQTGYMLTYNYDCMNRVTRIESSEGQVKQYTYDSAGNVNSMMDANGNTTRYQYSPSGRLTAVVDVLGTRTEYSYDNMGGLTEIHQYGEEKELQDVCEVNESNRGRHFVCYERDILGHVETARDALGVEEGYIYDDMGRVIEKRDREGFSTKYDYTKGGQLSEIQYADGKSVKLGYNSLKQLVEITDWLGVTAIEVDELGRPEKITDQKGREVIYTRGELGQRLKLQYPGGKTVEYGYDESLRLTSLRDENGELQYNYDSNGKLTEKLLPNGIRTNYIYDVTGALTSLVHSDMEGMLDSLEYQYDAIGNKVEIKRQRRGLPEENGEFCYAYDALNRLTAVEKDGMSLRNYGYDAFGNRTFLENEEGRTDYSYNMANQLIHSASIEDVKDYSYDARGNLIQIIENGIQKQTYAYNCMNRLQQAADDSGKESVYTYNGLGQRIRQQIIESNNPVSDITYILDHTKSYHNLLQQVEEDHIQEFLWDGNIAGAQGKDGACYYLQDDLGSPLRYTDTEGKVIESYGFDEFGNNILKEQKECQPFGYAGFYQDNISGTYFAQAREYVPQTGRFTARDIVSGFQAAPYTLNEYGYCWNRPLTFVDHNGAFPSLGDIKEEISEGADAVGDWFGDTVNSAGDTLSDATTTFFDGADYVWDNYIPQEVQPYIKGAGNVVIGGGRELIEQELFGVSISDIMAEATKSWAGEVFLDTVSFDRDGDIYHAKQNCWQAPFGYNDFYDYVFNAATSMKQNKYPFTTTDGTNYTIWMWKGDYVNLGAGAETGIYYGDGYHNNSATDSNLHMSMSVYEKESGELIFSYNPSDPQWWIYRF